MTEDTLGPGWEAVTVDFCGVPTLRRIEVPGGWLYLAGILGEGAGEGRCTVCRIDVWGAAP